MRAFLDVLRFELRLQWTSPLFYGVLLLFFLIHLLTMAQVGVHLSDNELIDINSAYLIFRAELVLSVFGMLPALLFVVNAATRDHEWRTVESFYVTPVARLPFLLGRFSGGALCALLVGLAGLLGSVLVGQWVARITPTDEPLSLWIWIAAPLMLAFAVIIASVLPARRALASDPLMIMKEDH